MLEIYYFTTTACNLSKSKGTFIASVLVIGIPKGHHYHIVLTLGNLKNSSPPQSCSIDGLKGQHCNYFNLQRVITKGNPLFSFFDNVKFQYGEVFMKIMKSQISKRQSEGSKLIGKRISWHTCPHAQTHTHSQFRFWICNGIKWIKVENKVFC